MKALFSRTSVVKICAVLAICIAAFLSLCSFDLSENDWNNENNNLQIIGLSRELNAENETFNADNGQRSSYEGIDTVDDELRRIYEEFISILPEGLSASDSLPEGKEGIEAAMSWIFSKAFGEEFRRRLILFIGICLMLCFGEHLCRDSGELSATMGASARICLSVPVLISAGEIVISAGSGIASGSEFFSRLIPIATATAAIGSGASAAGAAAAGMSFSLSFVSLIIEAALMPVSGLIFSVSLISSFDTGKGISDFSRSLRGLFSFVMGLVALIISATVSFNTVIAASADSLAMRSARYAASSMIPIVGNVISGTLSSIASGAKLLSGSIGMLSVITLLYYMGAPLFSMLGIRLCLCACVTLSSYAGAAYGRSFFESLRGAIDCLIGVVGSSAVIYVLEIIVLFRAVTV